jgi:hypothetical protein
MGTCCTTIEEANVGVIERWGKFSHLAPAGWVCLNCCADTIRGYVSLRIQQLSVKVETKTKDNVRFCLLVHSDLLQNFVRLKVLHYCFFFFFLMIVRSSHYMQDSSLPRFFWK